MKMKMRNYTFRKCCTNSECKRHQNISVYGDTTELETILKKAMQDEHTCRSCNIGKMELVDISAFYEKTAKPKINFKKDIHPNKHKWFFEFRCNTCYHIWGVDKYITEEEANLYLLDPTKVVNCCPLCAGVNLLTVTASNAT